MRFALTACALVVVAIGTAACVDPVSPDVSRSDRIVVDGLVTDGPGPHTVELRRAAAYEQSLDAIEYGITGAQVIIRDDTGGEVRLGTTIKPGRYRTKKGELVGRPGRTYTLHVELPDGRRFRSTPETMPVSPGIRDLQAVGGSSGITVFVSTTDSAGVSNLFRWKLDNAFALPAMRGSQWYVDRSAASKIAVGNDVLYDGGTIRNELFSIPQSSSKLIKSYSVIVRQRSLTRNGYDFWKTVRQQKENQGTTFSNPPSRIPGNVANVDAPLDVAAGIFEVSSTAVAKLCIDPRDYPAFRRPRRVSLPRYATYERWGDPSTLACDTAPGVPDGPEEPPL
jgi:hypothetical protein